MTIDALKALVMRQLGEDVEDVADYTDLLDAYLQEGYMKFMDKRMSGDVSEVEPLATSNELPEWTHAALADYATYRILSNGNVQKQQRAQVYYGMAIDVLNRMKTVADEAALVTAGGAWAFTNLYAN